MVDRDNFQELGLDADQYIAELNRIVQEHVKAQRSVEDMLGAWVQMGSEGRVLAQGFSILDDRFGKINVTMKQFEGGMEVARVAVTGLTEVVGQLPGTIDDSTQAMDALISRIKDVEAAKKTEQAIRKSFAKEQADEQELLRRITEIADKENAKQAQAQAKAEEQAASESFQVRIDYVQRLKAAISQERIAAQREEERARKAAARDAEISARAAARTGASLGGSLASGSFSFTSLGSAVSAPNLGVPANFAIGAAAGTATALLDNFIRSVENAAKESEKFQLAVARIRGMAGEAAGSTRDWTTALYQLSSAYNIPAIEVAQAAQRGLNTQIIHGAEDTRALAEALKLARATGEDTTATIQALSAVMNTYGLTSSESERASGALFNAVKLGNIDIRELSNGIGRVTALAAPMGVSLEEVMAALETLRTGGVSTDQALAGLSQLLAEFQRPSKATQEALTRLGFASGQSALNALGLVGSLKELNEQVVKNERDISDLFPNLRGLRTDFLLTSEGADTYTKKLAQAKDGTTALDDAVDKVSKASGQRWRTLLNEINNELQEQAVLIPKVEDALATLASDPTFLLLVNKSLDQLLFGGKLGPSTDAAESLGRLMDQAKEAMGFLKSLGDATLTPLFNAFGLQSPFSQDEEQASIEKTKELINEKADAQDAGYKRQLKLNQDFLAKKNALNKDELDALNKSKDQFIEALKRKEEGAKESLERMRDEFEKNNVERALGRTTGTQHDDLIEARIKVLNERLESTVGHFQGLQGQAFLDSKDPEIIRRNQEEIVHLRERELDEAIKQGAADSVIQDRQEALTKEQRKQLDLAESLEQLDAQRRTHAEGTLKFQRDVEAKEAQAKILMEQARMARSPQEAAALRSGAETILASVRGPAAGKLEGFGGSLSDAGRMVQNHLAILHELGINMQQEVAQRNAYKDGLKVAEDALVSNSFKAADGFEKATHAIILAGGTILDVAGKLAQVGTASTKGTSSSEYMSADSMAALVKALSGGILGFAAGGLATTDTIPAMLSAGEMVINRSSTSMFYPLLRAINDRTVRGYAEGGVVTNVGDINITVRGGQTSQETLAEIQRGIRKSIRRGLFNP